MIVLLYNFESKNLLQSNDLYDALARGRVPICWDYSHHCSVYFVPIVISVGTFCDFQETLHWIIDAARISFTIHEQ